MKINANKFGIAGALTISILYSIYAFFLKLWPIQTITFAMGTHLIKSAPLARYLTVTITPSAYFTGLLAHAIFGYFFLAILALIYNSLQHNQ